LSSDPQVMRAVVLEAITALEAFVHQTVFRILHETLDPLLAKWLEKKTRMDFDARLGVLTPVALGQPVDRASDLWNRYKHAKQIRNSVTHSGMAVSEKEAREVLRTVYDWLAYLGSTAEVDLALLGFKRFVENERPPIPNERAAEVLISQYFGRTKAASSVVEQRLPSGLIADVILTFGQNSVVLEIKLIDSDDLTPHGERAVSQIARSLEELPDYRAGVILLNRKGYPPDHPAIAHRADGRITVAFISIGPAPGEEA